MIDFFRVFALLYAGAVFQLLILFRFRLSKNDLGILLFCFLLSFAGLVPARHQVDYNPETHLLIVVGAFSLLAATIFRDRVLKPLNEQVLLYWNILFLYAVYLFFVHFSSFMWLVVIPPSIATLSLSFIPHSIGKRWKSLFYVWFLIIILGITFLQFNVGDFENMFDRGDSMAISNINAFIGGMAIFVIVANISYLIMLIPIPSKHEGFSARLPEIRKDLRFMASRFTNEQARWQSSLTILFILGILFTANEQWHIVPGWFLINVTILFFPVVFWLCTLAWGELTSHPGVSRSNRKGTARYL